MLEFIATAAIAATAVLVVLTIASIYARTPRGRILLISAFTVWFCIVIAIGVTQLFHPGKGIGVIGLAIAVTVPLLTMAGLGIGTARGRHAAARAPLTRLVSIQIPRLVGVFFVLLYIGGKLPAPFGPSAGWGDVLVGLLAIPATLMTAASDTVQGSRRALLLAFHALGTADLLTALTLGATSSPGPIQIFHSQTTTASMLTLPWILIPCFLVPSYLFLHAVAFYRLRTPRNAQQRTSLEAASQPI